MTYRRAALFVSELAQAGLAYFAQYCTQQPPL